MFKGDFKNNASISLINVYRLSKVDLLLKLILRYVINVFSGIMPSFIALECSVQKLHRKMSSKLSQG